MTYTRNHDEPPHPSRPVSEPEPGPGPEEGKKGTILTALPSGGEAAPWGEAEPWKVGLGVYCYYVKLSLSPGQLEVQVILDDLTRRPARRGLATAARRRWDAVRRASHRSPAGRGPAGLPVGETKLLLRLVLLRLTSLSQTQAQAHASGPGWRGRGLKVSRKVTVIMMVTVGGDSERRSIASESSHPSLE